jgi:hypothetical protein
MSVSWDDCQSVVSRPRFFVRRQHPRFLHLNEGTKRRGGGHAPQGEATERRTSSLADPSGARWIWPESDPWRERRTRGGGPPAVLAPGRRDGRAPPQCVLRSARAPSGCSKAFRRRCGCAGTALIRGSAGTRRAGSSMPAMRRGRWTASAGCSEPARANPRRGTPPRATPRGRRAGTRPRRRRCTRAVRGR